MLTLPQIEVLTGPSDYRQADLLKAREGSKAAVDELQAAVGLTSGQNGRTGKRSSGKWKSASAVKWSAAE